MNVEERAMPMLQRARRRVLQDPRVVRLARAIAWLASRVLPGARWEHRVAKLSLRLGEHDRAQRSLLHAVDARPQQPGWLRDLAAVAERRNDRPTAAWAWLSAAQAGKGAQVGADLRGATDHLRALRAFEAARRPLEELAERHPGDLWVRRVLIRMLADQLRWGGSLQGDLRRPELLRFVAVPTEDEPGGDVPNEAQLRARLIELSRQMVEALPDRPAWRVRLADALTARGDLREAVEHYAIAVEAARHADGRWAWRRLHDWEFDLERCWSRLGEPRVADPLFDVELHPGATGLADVATGVYTVEVMHEGVRFHGWTRNSDIEAIEILHSGRLLRRVNIGGHELIRGFAFALGREAVAALPERGTIEVRTSRGDTWLAFSRYLGVDLRVGRGDGRIFDRPEGQGVDKKGALVSSPEESAATQRELLDLYAEVRDYFDDRLGRPLLVLYGTLLGAYRDGALIPGDDDFDVGYVSRRQEPGEVKAEAKGIIRTLLAGGYTVSLNRRGRPFRVHRTGTSAATLHLDVQAIWFQDGAAWLHNFTRLPADSDDLLPPATQELNDTLLYLPRQTEHFLAGHYGPGWRTPDPGFKYHVPRLSPKLTRLVEELHLTPQEYRAWLREFEDEGVIAPGDARFVALGGQPLYPLERFVT